MVCLECGNEYNLNERRIASLPIVQQLSPQEEAENREEFFLDSIEIVK